MNQNTFALDRIQAAVKQRQAEVFRLLESEGKEGTALASERDFLATLAAMIPAG
jgi:hypothetical protein